MILTVEDFLSRAYRREIIERVPLADAELAAWVALVPKADIAAHLERLKGIPDNRCFISKVHRGLLTRALAQA